MQLCHFLKCNMTVHYNPKSPYLRLSQISTHKYKTKEHEWNALVSISNKWIDYGPNSSERSTPDVNEWKKGPTYYNACRKPNSWYFITQPNPHSHPKSDPDQWNPLLSDLLLPWLVVLILLILGEGGSCNITPAPPGLKRSPPPNPPLIPFGIKTGCIGNIYLISRSSKTVLRCRMNSVRRPQRPPQSCQFGRCSIATMTKMAFWNSILSILTVTLDHSREFLAT